MTNAALWITQPAQLECDLSLSLLNTSANVGLGANVGTKSLITGAFDKTESGIASGRDKSQCTSVVGYCCVGVGADCSACGSSVFVAVSTSSVGGEV